MWILIPNNEYKTEFSCFICLMVSLGHVCPNIHDNIIFNHWNSWSDFGCQCRQYFYYSSLTSNISFPLNWTTNQLYVFSSVQLHKLGLTIVALANKITYQLEWISISNNTIDHFQTTSSKLAVKASPFSLSSERPRIR